MSEIWLPYSKSIENVSANQIIVADNLSPDLVISEILRVNGFHILQKNQEFYNEDKTVIEDFFQSENHFFDFYSTRALLNIKKNFQVEFSKKDDKIGVIQLLEKISEHCKPQHVRDSLIAIAEELFMNALYDAPMESINQAGTLVKDSLVLSHSKFTFLISETRVGIFCEDPYGALEPYHLIRRIHDVYSYGARKVMNMNSNAGAGLGCYMMFEHASTFWIGVEPRRRTVVGAFIPLGISVRQKEKLKKSIHIFIKRGGGL